MNTDTLFDRLQAAVTLDGDDAAIRMHTAYEPQAGPGAKVFPPTYLESAGTKYHMEQRWGADGTPVDVVVLDSYQSQANRCEQALRRSARQLGLPQILLRAELADRTVEISVLDAPHRSRDAYFVDSHINGTKFDQTDVGRALSSVTIDNATAALEHAPYDLVYGVWDSHRGRRIATKIARSYTSEMLGWHVLAGKRAATKGDPLNLPGKQGAKVAEWRPEAETHQKRKAEVPINELGHGMIPGQPSAEAGGVSVQSITRLGVLSLTGLSALSFPTKNGDVSPVGRATLAALALAGDRLAFAGAGLSLRSGSDLVRTEDRLEWVRVGGDTEPFALTIADATDLLATARERLDRAGLSWSSEPVVVEPSPQLLEVIQQTFYVPDLDASA